MDEMGIEEARARLGEIVDRARLKDEPTRITRHGKPAVVVVGVQWFEHAAATLDMLAAASGLIELAFPDSPREVHHKLSR